MTDQILDSNGLIDFGAEENWTNDPWSSDPTIGMSSDGNGNWYTDPNGVIDQNDFIGSDLTATGSNSPSAIAKLLQGLGLPSGTVDTISSLLSAGLIGNNLIQSTQNNELNQEVAHQGIANSQGALKTSDFNNYANMTKGAGDQTTSARDNLLLRQYMEQTQPYNQEREMAILGKDGIDTGGLQALRASQAEGRKGYINDLLGYEGDFKGYASDLIGMRDQDQMYNYLKPNQGALNTVAVSQPPVVTNPYAVPQGAPPAQAAAYQQYLASYGQG
jgi:hypothetical protein